MRQPVEVARALVAGVRSEKRPQGHVLTVTIHVPDPDQVGDELDDAQNEIATIRLTDRRTGEVIEFLGYLQLVDLRAPETKPAYLVLKASAMRRHSSPTKLRRLARREVQLWLAILGDEMRRRVLAERDHVHGEQPQVQ